jgi:hemerythrin-like domain-containing protein
MGTWVAPSCFMSLTISSSSRPISDHLLGDHRRLEVIFKQVLAAVAAGDQEGLALAWSDFEAGLLTHLDAEEKYLIPALLKASTRDARAIVTEHQHIRTRLAELGAAVDLHTLRFETAKGFIDELRAHARREDAILYRWADDSLDPAERTSLFAALSQSVRRAIRQVGKVAGAVKD